MRGSIVRWFPEKAYGFIKPAKGSHDAYLHVSKIIQGVPRYGADVEFEMDKDNTKRTFAVRVTVLN